MNQMNPIDAMRLASRIQFAKILSLQDIAEEQASLVQRPKLPPHLLYASLPDHVVSSFEQQMQNPLSPQFALLSMPCGAMLAVVTMQAKGVQLRTAVPLVDQRSKAWVDSCITSGRIAWLMDVHECRQAVLITLGCRFDDEPHLRRLVARSHAPSSEMLALNLAEATGVLAEIDAVSSCSPRQLVEEVYVLLVSQALNTSELRTLAETTSAAASKLH